MGAVFPGHVSKIVGAQLGGEEDGRGAFFQHGIELFPGQGFILTPAVIVIPHTVY